MRHSYLSLRGPLTEMNVLVVFICCLAVYEFTLPTFPGSSSLWSSGVSTYISPSFGRLCPYHLLFCRFITESGVCTRSNPVLGVVCSACGDRLSLCRLLISIMHLSPSRLSLCRLLFRPSISRIVSSALPPFHHRIWSLYALKPCSWRRLQCLC